MKKFSLTCVLVALVGASALGYSGLGIPLTTPDTALAEVTSGDPVLVGAGDIASCDERGDEKTARLLDDIAGTVLPSAKRLRVRQG